MVPKDYDEYFELYTTPSFKIVLDDASKDLAELRSKTYLKNAKDILTPTKIIYNDPATIVFWADGTKTVVKKAKGTEFNKYNAFCAALAKKLYGNNSITNRIVNQGIEQEKKD